MEITDLQPASVWRYFYRITQIPRPSKKEGRVLAYLKTFADEQGLAYQQDRTGNIVIYKPAQHSPSEETIVLQSHVDMVCEKDGDIIFDFERDSILPYIDGEWVKARGTTLGADCGIGMAVSLAVLADRDISHPALECLFTVDEETGLTGAFGLAPDLLSGKYLINLDSEDEGEIFIGCAGGVDTLAEFEFGTEERPSNETLLTVSIDGLQGGHSGDDIHRGYANANVLAARLLTSLRDTPLHLLSFDGGNLRNAIPREARIELSVPPNEKQDVADKIAAFARILKNEFRVTEPGMTVTVEETPDAGRPAIDGKTFRNLVRALFMVPNGVMSMSQDIPGFVETSTNLASVKMTGENVFTVSTSQRSSVDSRKKWVSDVVETVFSSSGATVRHSEGYPGWEPVPGSRLLTVFQDSYRRLFGREAAVKTIHAGLECGLFLEKYPHLQMVSVGPTIRKVHSPGEMLRIDTVGMFWKLLTDVLKEM